MLISFEYNFTFRKLSISMRSNIDSLLRDQSAFDRDASSYELWKTLLDLELRSTLKLFQLFYKGAFRISPLSYFEIKGVQKQVSKYFMS